MPYIKPDERPFIDVLVKLFIDDGKITGRLNYFLFKLCLEYVKLNKESYSNYSEFINEIEKCRTELLMCIYEIQRRKVGIYENKKIRENGDVE